MCKDKNNVLLINIKYYDNHIMYSYSFTVQIFITFLLMLPKIYPSAYLKAFNIVIISSYNNNRFYIVLLHEQYMF